MGAGLWKGWIVLGLCALLLDVVEAGGFDNKRNDNVRVATPVYWGQNSGGDQQRLSFYCQDDVYNAIPLAFLYVFFGTGGEPMMSFAHTCNEGNGTFPGTALSNCTFLAPDIEECQSKGKIVTLSLGGAASSVGFTSEGQAEDFATTIWNSFLGGSSDMRPFGSAVLDGVDLDIEGGLPTYYNNFVDKLQSYTDKAEKTYYYTAAPQCPFPDAYTGPAINQSRFDAIYVQFYNNYCGLNYPEVCLQFDFGLWDEWARTQSPNPDVKIYIGAPGSATAAHQGYVDIDTLEKYALAAQGNYTTFGGVMLWDASDAYGSSLLSCLIPSFTFHLNR
ncbi:glycoside hydrolase [Fomitiporia mediterranea MF3/22]|uniref:glycoside hydrolase n=1 Tax=Fomitiporia mediterranea (strain MF3/22) TaxID=694068 RepID=UPI0004409668|nr:glycoside hydrolase [Fomitiporia mediterranea MF3/22]EJD07126.1 glycoside hydrolase [Fomitiporia mediterranea MF3/22]